MAESEGGIFFVVAAIAVAGMLVMIMVLLMPELLTGISSSMAEISGESSTSLEKQETYSKDDYGI